MQRRERDRQRILDVFGHIPDIISTACTKSKQFPDDKKLHDLLDELKVTLFDTIPNLVDLLRPKTLCKSQQSEPEQTLCNANKRHSDQNYKPLPRLEG